MVSRFRENFLEIRKKGKCKKAEKISWMFFRAFFKYWKYCSGVSILSYLLRYRYYRISINTFAITNSDSEGYRSHRGGVVQFRFGTTFPPLNFQHKYKVSHTRVDLYVIRTWRDIEVDSWKLVRLSSRFYSSLRYNSKSESHTGKLMWRAPSMLEVERRERRTKSESHKSTSMWFRLGGMLESRLGSWCGFPAGSILDSDIPPSPNRIQVNSCVGCLLLMLEVERREYHTETNHTTRPPWLRYLTKSK